MTCAGCLLSKTGHRWGARRSGRWVDERLVSVCLVDPDVVLMPHLWCSGRGEAEGWFKLLTTQMGLSAATTVHGTKTGLGPVGV